MLRQVISDTTDSTPGNPKSITHALGVIPEVVAFNPKGNAIIWLAGKSATKIDIACNVAGLAFDMYIAVDHSIIK